jgi:hypothetical protein
MMITTLLLSTFTRLLRLTLDERHRLLEVASLHQGWGIYFGLTSGRGQVFAVARNLDINKRVQDRNQATNNILTFPWPSSAAIGSSWTVPGASDLHQIRFHDDLVWIVNGRRPELLAVDPVTRTTVGQAPLADLVPAGFRHDPPVDHPEDYFHFNSLFFRQDRLFVLAHNWDHGSFVLEFLYQDAASFLRDPRLLRIHADLGMQSHDVFHDGQTLFVLDSAHGRLATNDGRACVVGLTEQRRGYLRGLAVPDSYFYIGQGSFSDARIDRLTGMSWISVVDRKTLEVAAMIEVGPYGNTCDLLLLTPENK